jgi:dihydroxyacetone kinase
MPGAAEPLFTVPEGRMAIGLGIHGEPGLAETAIPSADGLAELFVEHLLADVEIPDGVQSSGARVVPILNGLGSVKSEELFVVYRRVAELAEAKGLTLVDPQVGEFCTSFDMAGVSLTLFWLDDELERLWLAPADTPAFRVGAVDSASLATLDDDASDTAEGTVPPASEDSQQLARLAAELLGATFQTIDENAEELGRIDAIAGDGDHGIGMQRGAKAAAAAAASLAEQGAGAGTLLIRAADAWADRAGGTSGALWGVILRTLGSRFGDSAAPEAAEVAEAVSSASEAVMAYGKAKVGEKTMVDALVPFAATLAEQVRDGAALTAAWIAAAEAASRAADATADLMPLTGRARSHGEKALGVPDPGAISLALIVTTIGSRLAADSADLAQ